MPVAPSKKKRERERAAALCQKLDVFLPTAKRKSTGDGQQSDPLAIVTETNSATAAATEEIECSDHSDKEVNMEAAIEKYNDDLPSPELISTELRRWKARYCEMAEELRPCTPAAAIKDCDSDLYPQYQSPTTSCLHVACDFL
ncbi:hypothetical protein EMCRGX_G009191 [Ephydatia muelleri]